MCLCTGFEQTLKRVALNKAKDEAEKALKKNDTYFQELENAKKFYKSNLNLELPKYFGGSWQKVHAAVKHSHKVRHVSPLIDDVNEKLTANGRGKPIPVAVFAQEFVEILINGMNKFTADL
jgi:hypothetical protein